MKETEARDYSIICNEINKVLKIAIAISLDKTVYYFTANSKFAKDANITRKEIRQYTDRILHDFPSIIDQRD